MQRSHIAKKIVDFRYSLSLIAMLFLMALTPMLFVSRHKSDVDYVHPMEGVLSTDSYVRYPYAAKNLEIGFSRYGELVTPQNGSYTENGLKTGRGLAYDGLEAFACPDGQGKYYPLEGWLLQYNFTNLLTKKVESGLAYALYSDLEAQSPETGRTENLLAEPIRLIYDGPRSYVAQATVHILHGHDSVIDLKQTIVFNKVLKHVIVLMDVEFTESPDYAESAHIRMSRRVAFRLAHSLTSEQGYADSVYADFRPGVETPYRYPDWPGHNATGYYDLSLVYVTTQLTGGPEYTGFAAYWPNVTSGSLYGWDEWNQVVNDHPSASSEPKPALLVAQWDTVVPPKSSKRFVAVYGIVDGAPQENRELELQLGVVFNPWDLHNATKSDLTYQWALLSRNADAMGFEAESLMQEVVKVKNMGFDGLNPKFYEIPYLFDVQRNDGYRDTLGRLHFKERWNDAWIVGSNIVVLGEPATNMGVEYFTDFISVFVLEKGLYTPSDWKKSIHIIEPTDNETGYAVVAASRDLNGTSALIIFGVPDRDAYYAAYVLKEGLFEEMKAMPPGVTALIVKFNYTLTPRQYGFYEVVAQFGTITEFGIQPKMGGFSN